MAIYKIFPTQDTTLYSRYPEMNTGLDEILEASLEVGAIGTPAPQTSRFLIQFDSTEITDTIDNKISGSTWQSNLRCFIISSFLALQVIPLSSTNLISTSNLSFS